MLHALSINTVRDLNCNLKIPYIMTLKVYKTIIKILKIGIAFAVINYILAGIFLFVFQRNFLYLPSQAISHNFKTLQYNVDEASINIIVLNEGKAKAIIYFGGNGESVVSNAEAFSKTFKDHTIYLMNYRGYGQSTGSPTEAALFADAQYLYDAVDDQHKAIAVIGRSLGSGIAVYLASTRAVSQLVLVTPYDSMLNVIKNMRPIFPISLLLKDQYDSESRVQDINAKTLVILAENDRVILKKNSLQLIRQFPPAQITVEVIKNTGHNTLSSYDIYYQLLEGFMYTSP